MNSILYITLILIGLFNTYLLFLIRVRQENTRPNSSKTIRPIADDSKIEGVTEKERDISFLSDDDFKKIIGYDEKETN